MFEEKKKKSFFFLQEFVIVNPEGSNYLIAAESEEERDSWVRAIQKVVQVEDSIETGLIEKRGILKFRNIPKFFVLKEGVLMWFASENDATLEGSTTLMSATIALGQTLDGGPAFVIATLETKFVIGCESRGEAEDWAAQIKASINASKAKNLAKIQDEEANIFTNDQVPHFEGGSRRDGKIVCLCSDCFLFRTCHDGSGQQV